LIFFGRPALRWTVAIVLGAVFVYASLDKIAHPAEFARIVYHYRILGPSQSIGPWLPNLLAVTLPWIEIVAGVLLMVGIWRREAAGVVGVLLLVFIGAVSWALLHGIDIEHCGCFTVSGTGRRAGINLLLEDLAMLAGALVLCVGPEGPGATASSSPSDEQRA
jgi:uncharacterized membrane protein YphA (DoxX/SURF4 family)